ncbi:hypothetical protein COEREDRAFT_83651, partial [Coemansia reversa NRRL 1564]
RYGSVPEAWNKVAEKLNSDESLNGLGISGRGCRNIFSRLIEKRKSGEQSQIIGAQDDEYAVVNHLLDRVIADLDEYQRSTAEHRQQQQQNAEQAHSNRDQIARYLNPDITPQQQHTYHIAAGLEDNMNENNISEFENNNNDSELLDSANFTLNIVAEQSIENNESLEPQVDNSRSNSSRRRISHRSGRPSSSQLEFTRLYNNAESPFVEIIKSLQAENSQQRQESQQQISELNGRLLQQVQESQQQTHELQQQIFDLNGKLGSEKSKFANLLDR